MFEIDWKTKVVTDVAGKRRVAVLVKRPKVEQRGGAIVWFSRKLAKKEIDWLLELSSGFRI